MSAKQTHWHTSREIVKRIVIQGELVLETPTHLGNGETVGPTDMNLLRDSVDHGKALLTGASIAGALRSYLREVQHGYGESPSPKSPVISLFGGAREDEAGLQSLLIVDDARSTAPAEIEIRDGVRIDPATGTAEEGAKFDIELLQAGTTFPLRFELLIPQKIPGNDINDIDEDQLKSALAQALHGFEESEIPLGARKRRGFGRCRVEKWRVMSYDLTTIAGLLAWLNEDESAARTGDAIAALLETDIPAADARERFRLDATFRLDGSLLIRAEAESGADAGHLHSPRPDAGNAPVLPGASLAGVLRHRALRIANTLAAHGHPPQEAGSALVNAMFGSSEDDQLTASRVAVQETVLENVHSLVQTRVKIDRFTGGAYPTALFSEEPVFGGPDSRVHVKLTLRKPQDYEVGLLMLLLKDLWTSDLPLGGERSVGRGRLQGIEAEIRWQQEGQEDKETVWTLREAPDGLEITADREKLEKCVAALATHLARGEKGEER